MPSLLCLGLTGMMAMYLCTGLVILVLVTIMGQPCERQWHLDLYFLVHAIVWTLYFLGVFVRLLVDYWERKEPSLAPDVWILFPQVGWIPLVALMCWGLWIYFHMNPQDFAHCTWIMIVLTPLVWGSVGLCIVKCGECVWHWLRTWSSSTPTPLTPLLTAPSPHAYGFFYKRSTTRPPTSFEIRV